MPDCIGILTQVRQIEALRARYRMAVAGGGYYDLAP